MSRPNSVKVFGQKYKIKYDLGVDDKEGTTLGLTDQWSNTIRLQGELTEDKLAHVLMHEVTHAVIDESTMAGRKRFGLEEVCDIVGAHIVTVLKDNPTLTQWVLKEVEEE